MSTTKFGSASPPAENPADAGAQKPAMQLKNDGKRYHNKSGVEDLFTIEIRDIRRLRGLIWGRRYPHLWPHRRQDSYADR
jgi:hypothetical protein